ncbi:MAG: ATP-binding protein [Butyrivibrio sp.]|nr:ATP-binding protein [Butyrivibrio sp.]
MREDELIVYKKFNNADILDKMSRLFEHSAAEKIDVTGDRECMYECMNGLTEIAGRSGFYGNLWHCYLTTLLVNDENSYSMATEIRGNVEGTINHLALHDIAIFKEFFNYDFTILLQQLSVPEFDMLLDYHPCSVESKMYNHRIRDRICVLAKALAESSNANEMKDILTQFYKEYGVGKFGLHKAFRILHSDDGAQIIPIKNIRHVNLEDLVGYEIAKKKLIDNTEAFVEGRMANNCLLYGDAGTGKSSSIKAIANAYFDQGLRIIEVYKHQFQDLNDVIDQIKGRNYRFIIYMDDLSFEEFEIEYKYLKAVIEGGLEKKPENVLIYATSNRRHLIRESFKDKPKLEDDDIHRNDTVQEKLSLVDRFGVTIYFGAPDQKEFRSIVKELAERNGINIQEDELYLKANRWEMSHGGLSGRTAQQFIDYLVGTERMA